MERNCVSARLTAGTKDNLHVLESGPVLYVVTLNLLMEYVGLDVYLPAEEDIKTSSNHPISPLVL